MLCCRESEGEQLSVVEAIELIHERMRDVGVQISTIEGRMVEESRVVKRAARDKDMEMARVHMRRIRAMRERRTRYLQVREKLWVMKETLNEQSHYAAVQDTFSQGLLATETLLQKVNLDKVEEMMDRWEDAEMDTREVGSELGRDMCGEEEEEEEVWIQDQLHQLMKGVEEECSAEEVFLPSVPTTEFPTPKKVRFKVSN